MSKGRFILGIGSGSTPSDNEMFGVTADQRERGKILADSIEIIQKIWASDPPYEIDGKYWNTHIKNSINADLGFGWMPKPYRKGGPPIAIPSSSVDSPSVKIAGSKGWGVITSALIAPEDVGNHWKLYREGCQEAGRTPDPGNWRVCRSVFVAATDEEARERAYSAESGYRYFFGTMHKVFTMIGRLGSFKSRPDMRDDEVTVDTVIDKRLILGSPKTVLNELIKLRQQAGPFGTLLLTAVDWAGPNAAWERESLTRLMEEVMPAFRAHEAAAAA